ncbi:MAG TPA: MFS transporter [Ktedonobacterales bacterium]|nr:MFS transporter [Ktedonobacterales bacterium]
MKLPAYKWIALSVTTLGSLMVALDSTIVILALPNMLADLHSNLVRMVWVIIGYLLVSTVLLLLFGRMADMFGRVKMYNLGFVVFTVGSVLCGAAPTDSLLIGARLIQGAGGAMLAANAMAIITEVFPANERGQAMGINAITWGAGSILGPVLGGLILAGASWRWIFLVNLPIGIIGVAAAYFLLHDIAPNPKGERFDLVGAVIGSVALLLLLLGLTSGIGAGWTSPPILGMFAVAALALVAFVIWERRVTYPMLDLHLFDNRRYAFSVAAATLQSLAVFAVNFLLIFYLQGVRAYSPLVAALVILPMSVIGAIVGPLSGRWTDRIGGTLPATLGLAAQALSLIWLAMLSPTSGYPTLLGGLTLMGIGNGLFWAANTAATMNAAPPRRLGVASATLSTMRNIGMMFSFAVAMSVAAASMPPAILNQVFLGTVSHLKAAVSLAFTAGMSHAFLASVVICVIAIVFSAVRGAQTRPESITGAQARPEASRAADAVSAGRG